MQCPSDNTDAHGQKKEEELQKEKSYSDQFLVAVASNTTEIAPEIQLLQKQHLQEENSVQGPPLPNHKP
jgi:hypothetical protein